MSDITSRFAFLTNITLAKQLIYTDPDTLEATTYGLGDMAWVLASTALVWIMIPGVGFFYSGLLRRKNALSMIFVSMMAMAVVSFQESISLSAIIFSSSKHLHF